MMAETMIVMMVVVVIITTRKAARRVDLFEKFKVTLPVPKIRPRRCLNPTCSER